MKSAHLFSFSFFFCSSDHWHRVHMFTPLKSSEEMMHPQQVVRTSMHIVKMWKYKTCNFNVRFKITMTIKKLTKWKLIVTELLLDVTASSPKLCSCCNCSPCNQCLCFGAIMDSIPSFGPRIRLSTVLKFSFMPCPHPVLFTATPSSRYSQQASSTTPSRPELCHISCTKSIDHITPLLIQLNWLPVQQRMHYKILLLTF